MRVIGHIPAEDSFHRQAADYMSLQAESTNHDKVPYHWIRFILPVSVPGPEVIFTFKHKEHEFLIFLGSEISVKGH